MRGRPPNLHLSKGLRIWADGDRCSKGARNVLFEVANARRVTLTLVCTESHDWPHSAYIRSVVIPESADAVSQRLLQLATEGDIVVSADKKMLGQLGKKVVAVPLGDTQSLAGELEEVLAEIDRQATAARQAASKAGAKAAEPEED